MSPFGRFLSRLRARFSLSADLRDGATGWHRFTRPPRANELDPNLYDLQYTDALEAWRKNPYAKRVIDLITDYTIGDNLEPVANGEIGRFVQRFWNHPQNLMTLRLPDLVDELSRAGDLFLVLFRNPADGMSYVRAIPKSQIKEIVCSDNDWEMELAYVEKPNTAGVPGRTWLSYYHPDAATAEAVMLHYCINRPVGALFGESELSSIIPWLQRYSRMLEDRVRLNAAARAHLWFVTVPSPQVEAKASAYEAPPEPGTVIFKDEGETWEMQTPNLHGYDAQHDLRAMRQAISAGSGQPPHWHGDGGDINRAVAQAMQDPAVRRLRRRQKQLQHMLTELCFIAYSRCHELGYARRTPARAAIRINMPDISREDNESLALAGQRLASAFTAFFTILPRIGSETLSSKALDLLFRFIGESLEPDEMQAVLHDLASSPLNPKNQPLAQDSQQSQPPQQHAAPNNP